MAKKKKSHTQSEIEKTMESATNKTIAHEIGGIQNDALCFGLHGVKSDIVGSHPLEASYKSLKSASSLRLSAEKESEIKMGNEPKKKKTKKETPKKTTNKGTPKKTTKKTTKKTISCG